MATEAWFTAKQRYDVVDRGYVTPCWVWRGSLTNGGYARAGTAASNGSTAAHRLYWEREHGPFPAGLDPDHLCRVRACVNPAHLEPVTRSENLTRGRVGARLTDEQVYAIRASTESGPVLAARYGVTRSAVSQLRRRKTWKFLPERTQCPSSH